jgi:NTP pyrophosphatase (non-canonical NTP hydrolase)
VTDSAATLLGLRTELFAFVQVMEKKLRENDHKIGWKNLPVHHLLARSFEEFKEVIDSLSVATQSSFEFRVAGHHLQCAASILRELGPYIKVTGKETTVGELADVANYCMMIADVCGGLSEHTGKAP